MYEPQEDSYLLQESIIEFLNEKKIHIALDMGTGTGIQGLTLIGHVETIILTDINKETIDFLKDEIKKLEDNKIKNNNQIKSKIRIYTGNLFEKIPEEFHQKINLIIFNPPYLPREKEEIEDIELTSGESGIETTKEFLTHSKIFLAKQGTIFFVASSLSKITELEEHMTKENYSFSIDRKKHISFEDIIIYKARLN
ncbi:MAG: methyltransferase [Candidatus Woesearchaeota archaeon]|jgi:HemK-related putative methylase